jgi:hypothetical protein
MTAVDIRSRWLLCVLFGAAVIGFAAWFTGVIPPDTCSGAPATAGSALLEFQLARTPADIEHVFGAAGDPCRQRMIAAMDRANTVDLVGFIATYGAFLACFFWATAHGRAVTAARVGLAAVAATVAFDVLETATQLRLTDALPGTSTQLTLLAIGSRGKYLGLAIASLAAGLLTWMRPGLLARIVAVVCVVGGALALVGLAMPSARAALASGGAAAWLAMWIYAGAAAIGRRPATATT